MSKVITFSLVFLTVLTGLILYFPKKEFRIEDHATVPAPYVDEYLKVQSGLPLGEMLTQYTPTYDSQVFGESLEGVQCPIPADCRVPNRTGIQCVWASLEMLGRWAEEPKLVNPPLTSRSDCKSFSSPSLVHQRLTTLNVKFEQSYNNPQQGLTLIKKAMSEGRGCLWGVRGHAMVLIHYDEATNTVKWVDNSDSRLAVQTTTVAKFKDRWEGGGFWICIIYADNDIIPFKMRKELGRFLEIKDMIDPSLKFPKDYVPSPNHKELILIP